MPFPEQFGKKAARGKYRKPGDERIRKMLPLTKRGKQMKHTHTLTICVAAVLAAIPGLSGRATLVTYDSFPLPPAGYDNGSTGHGGFAEGGAFFNNAYDNTFGSWSGFAVSNVNNPSTGGWGNQYAVAGSGTGYGGAGQYAVIYDDTFIGGTTDVVTFTGVAAPLSLRVNNTAYAAQSMLNGDGFAKKFGGAVGSDPDWFRMTIRATDAADQPTGSNVEVYLADFRSADPAGDYVLQSWQLVDLTPLGSSVRKLHFDFASTDNGAFGMNTPATAAFDNLVFVPEPATAGLAALGLLLLRLRRR